MSNDPHAIDSIEALIDVLAAPDFGLHRLKRVVENGELELWLDTRAQLPEALRPKIADLFRRCARDPARLLFGLRYSLCPDAPLHLVPGCSVGSPTEIGPLLVAHPDRRAELFANLHGLVESGRLVEWLRAGEFTDWQAMIGLVERVRRDHPSEPELPGYAVLWHYAPTFPLPFGSERIASPIEWVRCIDVSDDARRLSLKLLERGWIQVWLQATGQLGASAEVNALFTAPGLSPPQRLELLLRLLDPSRALPALRVDPVQIDFGVVRPGEPQRQRLRIENQARGLAWGSVALAEAGQGLAVSPPSFEDTPVELTVQVDVVGQQPGARRETRLRVLCDGETLDIPIRYRVGLARDLLIKRTTHLIAVVLALVAVVVGTAWVAQSCSRHAAEQARQAAEQRERLQRDLAWRATGRITSAGISAGLAENNQPKPFRNRFFSNEGPLICYVRYADAEPGVVFSFQWYREGQVVSSDRYSSQYRTGYVWSRMNAPLQPGEYQVVFSANGLVKNRFQFSVTSADPVAPGTYLQSRHADIQDPMHGAYRASVSRIDVTGQAMTVSVGLSNRDDRRRTYVYKLRDELKAFELIDEQGRSLTSTAIDVSLLKAPIASCSRNPYSKQETCQIVLEPGESAAFRVRFPRPYPGTLTANLHLPFSFTRGGQFEKVVSGLQFSRRGGTPQRAQQPTQVAALAPGSRASVNTTRLNVRAGPGTENAIVGRLERGANLRVLESRGLANDATWVRIDAGQVKGWVNARLLRAMP